MSGERCVVCPDCRGMGNDGMLRVSTGDSWETMVEIFRQHKCKTCDGFGKVLVTILGTARPQATEKGMK